jgi:hypothetical protein
MIGWIRRWPIALWLLVYVASIFVLNGGQGGTASQVAVGVVLILAALGLGVYLAIGPWRGHPRPRAFFWTFGGVAAFYLIAGAVAAHYNRTWGIAAVAGGLIPLTAVAILFAAVRTKTVDAGDRVKDTAAADEDDPYPSIGMNNVPQPEEEDAGAQEPPRDAPREPRFARQGKPPPVRGAPQRPARRR